MLDQILNNDPFESYLLADGFDDAVIGESGGVLIYSVKKCLDILIEAGAYVGEKTTIWCWDTY